MGWIVDQARSQLRQFQNGIPDRKEFQVDTPEITVSTQGLIPVSTNICFLTFQQRSPETLTIKTDLGSLIINADILYINDSEVYENTSIETLTTAKQYLKPAKFYANADLPSLVLINHGLNPIYATIRYEVSDISDVLDLAPLLAFSDHIQTLYLKESEYQVPQQINWDYLYLHTFKTTDVVVIDYRFKIFDPTNTSLSVINNIVITERASANQYEHVFDDWFDVTQVLSQTRAYRALDPLNPKQTGFLINETLLFTVEMVG